MVRSFFTNVSHMSVRVRFSKQYKSLSMVFQLLGRKVVFCSTGGVSCKHYMLMTCVISQVKGFESLGGLTCTVVTASKGNSFGKLFFLEVLRNKIRRQRKTYSHSSLWINDFG